RNRAHFNRPYGRGPPGPVLSTSVEHKGSSWDLVFMILWGGKESETLFP
ncbi:hypothetical protein QIJ49_gp1, partial [ssRNA phage SRR5208572_1]